MSKVEIKKEKINKKDSDAVKQEKKDTVYPVQKNKLLAIILKENKSSIWKWLNYDIERFKVGEHTYFKTPDGTYLSDNKVLLAVYVEGVCIPISHTYIEKEEISKKFINNDTGEERTFKLNVIKGMHFDSQLADQLLNRHLADEFMKEPPSSGIVALLILVVVGIIFSILSFVGQFFIK